MPDRSPLTEREIEILQQVATGASNRQIAQELSISANTVKVHLRNVYEKLGVASRTEATLVAIQSGLIEGVESDAVVAETRWWQRAPVIAGGALVLVMVTLLVGVIVSPGGPPPENTVDLEALERERWEELAPMPTARKGLAVAAYGGKIYAIAGETEQGVTGVVERYDPATDTWETLPSKPTPVTDVEAAVIGGKIYVPGGRLDNDELTNTVEVLNPETMEWIKASSLPSSISRYALASYEGILFMFSTREVPEREIRVWGYDPTAGAWLDFAGLSEESATNILASTSTAGIVLLVEESRSDAGTSTYLFQGENLLPVASMPGRIWQGGTATIADITHVFSGINPDGSCNFQKYYIFRDEWDSRVLQQEFCRQWFGVIDLDDKVYIIGGSIDEVITASVIRYQAIYSVIIPVIE